MADRIVIMKDGHIQQVGTPEDVYRNPANTFVARFIGAPSMNLVEGEARAGAIRLPGGVDIDLKAAEGPVTLGIRPDDLRPVEANGLLRGTVSVTEPLGPETLIYVDTPAGEMIAKASGRMPPKVGAQVDLGADLPDIHVFDRTTGEAIR